MAITLNLENKNNLTLTLEGVASSATLAAETKTGLTLTEENRITSPTWDESTETWDEADGTWDSNSKPLWGLEAKNNITLIEETK